jgi:asparagine synthase (glutamine-hydrolysing)
LPDKLKIRWAPDYLRVPAWISSTLAEKTRTPARKVLSQESPVFKKASKQYLYNMVKNAISVISAGYYRERGCVEVSCPFLHRPLVEFLLAIPSDQLVRPGDTRSLLRRSTRNLLPEKIRLRRDKRGPDEAIYKAIQREWPSLTAIFADAQIYARGYVDAGAFQQALQRARYGMVPQTQSFLRALALEIWLRTRVSGRGVERASA